MKIIVPIAIASILSERTLPPRALPVIISLVGIAIVVLLIAKQPDLGTALLIGASGIYVLFFSGFRIRLVKNPWLNLGLIFGILGGLFYAAWNYLLISYQKNRILTLFNPESDPLGSGYHILQSKIAIGSGGFFGKGFLEGTQTRFDFVPEQSTDFIFCTIGEEWGFLGSFIFIILFMSLLLRIINLAERQRSSFCRIYGYGVASVLFIHFAINIVIPITGVNPIVIPIFIAK
jgi:rod shape determining protein RodA